MLLLSIRYSDVKLVLVLEFGHYYFFVEVTFIFTFLKFILLKFPYYFEYKEEKCNSCDIFLKHFNPRLLLCIQTKTTACIKMVGCLIKCVYTDPGLEQHVPRNCTRHFTVTAQAN